MLPFSDLLPQIAIDTFATGRFWRRWVGLLALAAMPASAATSWIRVNQLGWHPDAQQKATILSDSDLAGKVWSLVGPSGKIETSGVMPSSHAAKGPQNPKAYGAVLWFAQKDTGVYRLLVPGAEPKVVRVARGGYGFLARQALRHLRLMRSGRDQSLFRNPSHLGDSACKVMVPSGAWSGGQWKLDPAARKVDVQGGWYDAGDQIKFTLTTAYTTYFLLRAWEENRGIQGKWLSASGYPDLLDEAAHGLKFLEKTLVDDTTFIVEVGDGRDHQQGSRLPEMDYLNGKRPALSALSPMSMGYAGAALALGARLFGELGDTGVSRRWEGVARRLHALVKKPNASRQAAYWKDGVNDFYRDDSPYDNLTLMAVELHRTTGELGFLDDARSWSDSAGPSWSVGWPDVGLSADLRLSGQHPRSLGFAKSALTEGARWATENASLWGYPEAPTWCPLLGWAAFGADAASSEMTLSDTTWRGMGWDVFDYVLGRNNWGLSFFMSPDIGSSVVNIYNPIYGLNEEYPVGAIAEGPGDKAIHESLVEYFAMEPEEPTEPFNTSTTVFYDNKTDFQTMETVIGQQATFLYLLAALTRGVGDTVPGEVPPPSSTFHRSPFPSALAKGELRVENRRLEWSLDAAATGVIVLVDAIGRTEIVASGVLPAVGSATLPPRSSRAWVVLRTSGRRLVAVLPPIAGS